MKAEKSPAGIVPRCARATHVGIAPHVYITFDSITQKVFFWGYKINNIKFSLLLFKEHLFYIHRAYPVHRSQQYLSMVKFCISFHATK